MSLVFLSYVLVKALMQIGRDGALEVYKSVSGDITL